MSQLPSVIMMESPNASKINQKLLKCQPDVLRLNLPYRSVGAVSLQASLFTRI